MAADYINALRRSYQSVQMSIAQKQYEVFSEVFDWENWTALPIELPRRRLFRAPEPTRREVLLDQLKHLVQKAEDLRQQLRQPEGLCWWGVPWEHVERFLMNDLCCRAREGDWRYSQALRGFPSENGTNYIVMQEEAHCTQLTQNAIYMREVVSRFSEEEREERMRKYDRKVRDYNLMEFAFFEYNDLSAKSIATGAVYDSILDYYVSEGYFIDSILRENYQRQMNQEHITQGIAVQSNSIHVTGVFLAGWYQTDGSGGLSGVQSCGFQPVAIQPKDYADSMIAHHAERDGFILSTAFLGRSDSIREVPFSMLEQIEGTVLPGEDSTKLLQQAEAFVCLSQKLIPSSTAK